MIMIKICWIYAWNFQRINKNKIRRGYLKSGRKKGKGTMANKGGADMNKHRWTPPKARKIAF